MQQEATLAARANRLPACDDNLGVRGLEWFSDRDNLGVRGLERCTVGDGIMPPFAAYRCEPVLVQMIMPSSTHLIHEKNRPESSGDHPAETITTSGRLT